MTPCHEMVGSASMEGDPSELALAVGGVLASLIFILRAASHQRLLTPVANPDAPSLKFLPLFSLEQPTFALHARIPVHAQKSA
jgi:hypothetical protein